MKKFILLIIIGYVLFLVGKGPYMYLRFHSLKENTTATIVDVKSRHIIGNRKNRHDEYSYTYEYYNNDDMYEGETCYVRPEYPIGSEIDIRFDTNNPEVSIADCEVDEALATSNSIVIVLTTVLLVTTLQNRKKKGGST